MAVRRHRVRTLFAGVLAAFALSTMAAAPAAAGSPPTVDPADAAAGWLARQLVDGERFEVVFDGVAYPDQGLTVDAVFAFAAAKVAGANAGKAMTWLARPEILTGYIGDGTEAYAGATAKLALAVQVRGGDPAAFGGVDLIGRLRGLQAPSGRFSDRSAFGDYSNAFTQSFALLTLDRTPAGAPATGATYLAGARCADGGFPLSFDQPTCVSDVDATALVVQALLAVGRPDAAAAAVTWLSSVQSGDGSFTDSAGVPNANSTGLAAQALRVAGRPVAWLKARGFLLSLQVRCAGPAAQRGGIAYSPAGFDPSTAVRATAQAVPGLTGAGLATLTAAGSRPAAPVLACP
ncbi:terpene cyclase/mutase family protein [Dactylosporangium roseum]|uniref:Terpene cyclase/mutase family protein n=1 Tax=Dactylosporangium roseum TaxID=47989 RepID=A0ABY5ZA66_9ACTN|nr:peptidase [Dactylosporangium roseum]UWZ38995.1 terpene cyclase/mutase family protein [Dactylosporangium roseum]